MNIIQHSDSTLLVRLWSAIWKILVFTILWGVAAAPFIVPFSKYFEKLDLSHPLQMRVYYDFSSFAVLLFSTWVMMHFIEHRSWIEIGFKNINPGTDLLFGILGGVIWLAIPIGVLALLGLVHLQSGGQLQITPILWAASAMILNVAAQEVLGRVYIFITLEKNFGSYWAIFISAIIFMLYHIGAFKGEWLPALNVFLAGILFAVAYKVSGNNLWLPIGLHFAWNFLLGPVFGLSISGQEQWSSAWHILRIKGPTLLTGGSFGIEGSIITLATTIAMTAIIYFNLSSTK